ncbi:MAG TPA: hypothetical protein VIJ09_14595 [Acidimicrobiales bacterium]
MAFATVAAVLPLLLLLTVDVGVAQAIPVFPGTVTCNASGGVWSGMVKFSPPLRAGGVATHETVSVSAHLGNTTLPCGTSATPPAGSKVLGVIKGVAKISMASANDCATIFSGSAVVPLPAKFAITWHSPAGAPTKWTQPPLFSFVGATNFSSLTITGGTVAGSFSPYLTPIATLSDANWPNSTGAVATGCNSTGGLHHLTLSTSSGTW